MSRALELRCVELRLLGSGWSVWEVNGCPRCRSENVRGRTGPGLAMIACLDCRHIIGTFDSEKPQLEVIEEWNGARAEAARTRGSSPPPPPEGPPNVWVKEDDISR